MEENVKRVKPDNFMVWAICSTIFCCLPAGIAAIVYANKVDSLWYAERYTEAEEALKKAKMWTYISAGAGVVVSILGFFMMMIAAMVS